jgi:hypothetical protein
LWIREQEERRESGFCYCDIRFPQKGNINQTRGELPPITYEPPNIQIPIAVGSALGRGVPDVMHA